MAARQFVYTAHEVTSLPSQCENLPVSLDDSTYNDFLDSLLTSGLQSVIYIILAKHRYAPITDIVFSKADI